VKPGDPVVLSWAPYCGNCFYCNRGEFRLCEKAVSTSRFRKDGKIIHNYSHVSSFAEYTVIPEAGAIPIRSDVPLDKAALVGCAVPTGWGAVVNTARVEPGASVAVIGLGGVGLSAVMGAVTVSAEKIIGVDINGAKLEMVQDFGVTHTINSSSEDMVERLKELTDGRGPDYAFDTIGLPEVTSKAYAAVRPGGTVVTVGMNSDWAEVTLSFPLIYGERKLLGCCYGSIQPPVDIPRIIDLYMAGKLDLDKLITKRFPIEKINDAFDTMLKGEVARSLIEF
ncbi:MAG: zinc-binding dehydrogenase, partial [Dehalococcoidia bacterium]